jgi:hypothetical protein
VKLQEGDAAGQRFAALADQLHRSGAEQQEATRSFSSPATSIDHPSQLREQPRQSLHLIEDHQLVGMTRQKQRRFRQAGPIGGRLQVEVEAGDRLRQLEGQGGARVVLPTWGGPSSATAGNCSSCCRTRSASSRATQAGFPGKSGMTCRIYKEV